VSRRGGEQPRLSLAHDIVRREKTVDDARRNYAKSFLDYRRRRPTPYMEKRPFEPSRNTVDPDVQQLSDHDLLRAVEEGESSGRQAA
jgi:hypothetical protein